MSEFVRLTMLCPAPSRAAFNNTLAEHLGPEWGNTFETLVTSGATELYFAGWQGDPETAETLRDFCYAYGVECYDTPPEGVPLDSAKTELAATKSDTPKSEKQLLYPQSVVLGALKPEALK